MKRSMALTAAGVLLAACAGAHAQTADTRLRMDTGFYLGAGVGSGEMRDFCTTIGGACDDQDVSWNVFAGYQINRNWAVEAGYTDFGEASTSGFVAGVPISVRVRSKGAELVGVGILPLGSNFSLYGKAGAFYYESDATTTGAIVRSSSDNGWHLTFGLGAQYDFNGKFATRIEWQRYMEVTSGLTDKADLSVIRVTGRYQF